MPENDQTVRDHYLEQIVESASQEKLLLLLVDGAVNFIRRAEMSLEKEKFDEANNCLIKAQNIFIELTITLDLEAGQFAENMGLVYQYIYNLLIEANLDKDIEKIRLCLKLSEQVSTLWHSTVEKMRTGDDVDAVKVVLPGEVDESSTVPETGVYEPVSGAGIEKSSPDSESLPSRLNITG